MVKRSEIIKISSRISLAGKRTRAYEKFMQHVTISHL